MNKVIADIINNKFESFEELSIDQKHQFLVYISNHQIKNAVLLKLLNTNYWYDIRLELFNMIYKDKNFIHHTVTMLVNNLVKFRELTDEQIDYLITTDWSLSFILIHEIIVKDNYFLTERIINNQEAFKKSLIILKKCQTITKITFIYEALCLDKVIEDNIVLELLSNQKYSLPKWFIENEKIKPLIIRNFNFFVELESECKMNLIDKFYDDIDEDILAKYKPFIDLYNLHKDKSVDVFLTRLINANEEEKLLPYLSDNLTYLNSGTTTDVYTDGTKVVKLTLEKYCPDTVKDLFLLAPTETIKINTCKKVSNQVIEIQSYLPKKKNGLSISKREIKRFLQQLDKYGYYTDDPNNLDLLPDNFGYLDDYHDANLTGFNCYEELPSWFKKRPLVLYDIDKVYKKKL